MLSNTSGKLKYLFLELAVNNNCKNWEDLKFGLFCKFKNLNRSLYLLRVHFGLGKTNAISFSALFSYQFTKKPWKWVSSFPFHLLNFKYD